MSRTLTLPTVLKLQWSNSGPHEGWHWLRGPAPDDAAVSVRTEGPITWAEPVGLAMLSAWSQYQRERIGRTVVLDDGVRSPVAWQSGLLSALTGRPRAAGSVAHDWLQPRRIVSEPAMADELAMGLGSLEIEDEATHGIAIHIVEDLARNVFHHAQTHGGGAHVAARYDRQDQTLRIGVADCGQGIARDIRTNVGPGLSDVDAVALAMEPEVSGSAQPGVNRGVGLYFVRRLTLACRGALWLKSGSVLVDISARTPDAVAVDPTVDGAEWCGCAVGVMLRLGVVTDLQRAMETIRRDLDRSSSSESRSIQFFKRDDPESSWLPILVDPDNGVIASDRLRARALALDRLAPELRRGADISLCWPKARVATQAFCHALLVGLCDEFGAELLSRMRFIGCSKQVMTVVRMALEYGLRQSDVREQPGP